MICYSYFGSLTLYSNSSLVGMWNFFFLHWLLPIKNHRQIRVFTKILKSAPQIYYMHNIVFVAEWAGSWIHYIYYGRSGKMKQLFCTKLKTIKFRSRSTFHSSSFLDKYQRRGLQGLYYYIFSQSFLRLHHIKHKTSLDINRPKTTRLWLVYSHDVMKPLYHCVGVTDLLGPGQAVYATSLSILD